MRKLIIPISIVLVVLAFLNAALGLHAGEAALAVVALATFVAAIVLLSAILARPKAEARRPAAETVRAAPALPTANQSNAEVVNFLAILQEKGRLVDFLMDDIKGYNDAQVGAAARVLHEGCRTVCPTGCARPNAIRARSPVPRPTSGSASRRLNAR